MTRELMLKRVAVKCADFTRQLVFHRVLAAVDEVADSNFWVYASNNFIDMAVLDWCHLFGSYADDLHWKNIVHDEDGFRADLLTELGLTGDEWTAYRDSVKDYRDKDVAHIEVRPRSEVPEMEAALHSVCFYYAAVIPELKGLGNYEIFPDSLHHYYGRLLEKASALRESKLHNAIAESGERGRA